MATVNSGSLEIRPTHYSHPPVAVGTFTSSSFTEIYRIFYQQPNDMRRVQRVRFALSTLLEPGRYWIVFDAFGSTQYSGPWSPYLTRVGELTTPGANAMQLVYGETIHWVTVYDAGSLLPQDLPFWIDGEKLPLKAQPGERVDPPMVVPDPVAYLQRGAW